MQGSAVAAAIAHLLEGDSWWERGSVASLETRKALRGARRWHRARAIRLCHSVPLLMLPLRSFLLPLDVDAVLAAFSSCLRLRFS